MVQIRMMDFNLRQSFLSAKRDIISIMGTVSEHHAYLKQLNNNQKLLLLRVREMEKRLALSADGPKEITVQKIERAKRAGYVGASTSMTAHNSVCPFAKNINPENRVTFGTRVSAMNRGYRLCRCLKSR